MRNVLPASSLLLLIGVVTFAATATHDDVIRVKLRRYEATVLQTSAGTYVISNSTHRKSDHTSGTAASQRADDVTARFNLPIVKKMVSTVIDDVTRGSDDVSVRQEVDEWFRRSEHHQLERRQRREIHDHTENHDGDEGLCFLWPLCQADKAGLHLQ